MYIIYVAFGVGSGDLLTDPHGSWAVETTEIESIQ